MQITKEETYSTKIIISKYAYYKKYRKWDHHDTPFLSPDFKNDHDSSEIYTPSFDHNNEVGFQKKSPCSILNQFKGISARKTDEPPYMRKKRRKQFKHRNDEAPYIGHIMIDNQGQQVLKPLYHTAHRGMSLPPPVPLDHHVAGQRDEDEEDKENSAALPYYPTCH
jgi:hypothetical protein